MNTHQTESVRLLLDLRETARALHVSQRTAWQLARDGELKSLRIGRCRRFDLRDIEAWIERKKAQ